MMCCARITTGRLGTTYSRWATIVKIAAGRTSKFAAAARVIQHTQHVQHDPEPCTSFFVACSCLCLHRAYEGQQDSQVSSRHVTVVDRLASNTGHMHNESSTQHGLGVEHTRSLPHQSVYSPSGSASEDDEGKPTPAGYSLTREGDRTKSEAHLHYVRSPVRSAMATSVRA